MKYKRIKRLPFDHVHPHSTLSPSPSYLSSLNANAEADTEEGTTPKYTAILYASPSSPNFHSLHTYLLSLSSPSSPGVSPSLGGNTKPKIEYILRWLPPNFSYGAGNNEAERKGEVERTYLSGWGVSLDLKKTDYLAVDDRSGYAHRDSGSFSFLC